MKRLGKETKSVEESIQLGESAWYLQQLGESALPKRRPAPTLVVWSTSPSRRRPDRLGVGPEIREYLTTGSQRERTSLLQKPAQRTTRNPYELMPTAARRTPRRETASRVEPEEFRDLIHADHPEDEH